MKRPVPSDSGGCRQMLTLLYSKVEIMLFVRPTRGHGGRYKVNNVQITAIPIIQCVTIFRHNTTNKSKYTSVVSNLIALE